MLKPVFPAHCGGGIAESDYLLVVGFLHPLVGILSLINDYLSDQWPRSKTQNRIKERTGKEPSIK